MQQKTVLIVDDEFFIVNALCVKFRNANFAVSTAGNGREALERIKEKRPDLVITDYQMPDMDGVELVKTLRSDPDTRSIPIIMLTARFQDIEDTGGGDRLGVDAYIAKPFSPKAMVAKSLSLVEQS